MIMVKKIFVKKFSFYLVGGFIYLDPYPGDMASWLVHDDVLP